MKTSKLHIAIVFILFALAGSAATGIVGPALLYVSRMVFSQELLESISYVAAFFIAAVPGFIGSFYWSYFFIKKERRETKHLHEKDK
ncbi:membrane associated rhomboid family serine protease [Alkalihalobacillus xiaoxiensis]|uniref:Membrane associated rhomboid family serine protease n=1 Tax=Shouchella xiaoxiensis TaxID=766895 RepID=A0ABS2T0C6_9BACI|nr:hypothetical protein [Shouchella xiaoxiensis]MBM7839937.1 membrane associated rhomboid family serine protease [Shouchella xiaoxiensis]